MMSGTLESAREPGETDSSLVARRSALIGAPAIAAGFLHLAAGTSRARAQSVPTDVDLCNFLLNLSYLEAQYHSYAATGVGLPASMLSGIGNAGTANGARQVSFSDPALGAYCREIAADKRAHVEWLRTLAGPEAIAQPSIDLSAAAGGGFSTLGLLAGIDSGGIFDPYTSENEYLLGSFIFRDLAVNAYRGVLNLATSAAAIETLTPTLAAEAYHAAAVRAFLYSKGIIVFRLIDGTEKLSSARDQLDGATDVDQGTLVIGSSPNDESNIVPADARGIPFSRSPQQVLNILYVNKNQVSGGGFFPDGLNGVLKTSSQN